MADGNWKRWRGGTGEFVARRRCAMRRRERERESEEGEAEDRRRDRGQEEWWRKCIVGDILPVYGPRHAGARCSDAHNGRDVHLPQEPIIRYGGRSLYVPPLSLARIAYGPPANSFLSNPISPPSVSPFCSPSPYWQPRGLADKMISGGMIDRRASETSRERKTSVLTPIVFSSCGVRFLLHRTRIPCII